MIDVVSYLPAKRKQTPSGWISFNAPCCADKRQRGGLKVSDRGWSYHCFNCQFTTSFILGRTLGFKTRKLLGMLNVSERDIDLLNLESLRHRSIEGILDERQQVFNAISDIKFEEFDDLPPHVELLTPEHTAYWKYIRERCVPEDYPIMVQMENDGVHWTRQHVIIPFTYNDNLVGWCARMLSGTGPKYINHSQPGYVFGTDLQKANWQHVLVMEGIFDALCVGGLALMHNTISDSQARLIRSLGKEITVVPDHDVAGMELVDRAIELGWAVSMPKWPAGIKDANDAVVTMGKLATLLTIFQARETSKLKIELRKKYLIKELHQ
jgi:DNA primase